MIIGLQWVEEPTLYKHLLPEHFSWDSRSSVSQECEQFEAAAGVNERLAADGYADDYSAEWDDLLKANGCR